MSMPNTEKTVNKMRRTARRKFSAALIPPQLKA